MLSFWAQTNYTLTLYPKSIITGLELFLRATLLALRSLRRKPFKCMWHKAVVWCKSARQHFSLNRHAPACMPQLAWRFREVSRNEIVSEDKVVRDFLWPHQTSLVVTQSRNYFCFMEQIFSCLSSFSWPSKVSMWVICLITSNSSHYICPRFEYHVNSVVNLTK